MCRSTKTLFNFERAAEEVAASARKLIASLVTHAEPRNREVEAAKARARSEERFGAGSPQGALHRCMGSVRAYALVKATGAKASLNLLWALEGALTGLPWQVVAKEHRLSLLLALETLPPTRG